MSNNYIEKTLIIGNTKTSLLDLANNFNDKNIIKNGLYYKLLGKWNYTQYLYLVHGNIGKGPNKETKIYNFNIEELAGIIDLNWFMINGSGQKMKLPYVYPATQYIDYWVTIEYFYSNSLCLIAGTDRSSWDVYMSGLITTNKIIK